MQDFLISSPPGTHTFQQDDKCVSIQGRLRLIITKYTLKETEKTQAGEVRFVCINVILAKWHLDMSVFLHLERKKDKGKYTFLFRFKSFMTPYPDSNNLSHFRTIRNFVNVCLCTTCAYWHIAYWQLWSGLFISIVISLLGWLYGLFCFVFFRHWVYIGLIQSIRYFSPSFTISSQRSGSFPCSFFHQILLILSQQNFQSTFLFLNNYVLNHTFYCMWALNFPFLSIRLHIY